MFLILLGEAAGDLATFLSGEPRCFAGAPLAPSALIFKSFGLAVALVAVVAAATETTLGFLASLALEDGPKMAALSLTFTSSSTESWVERAFSSGLDLRAFGFGMSEGLRLVFLICGE